MKKTLTLALIIILALTLAACSASAKTGGNFDMSSSISVISREDGSGTRGAFIELFGVEVKLDDGSKKDMTTKEAVIADKTDIMMTNIANDPYAIGYISLGSLNNNVKALDINSVKASVENIKNGTYSIQRPFNIAVKAEISDLARDFIDFILSKEGQNVVTDNKYIIINENALPFNGSNPSGKIVVSGSSSVTPVMEKLKEAYQKINTSATIEVQMTDSSSGMTSAMNGTCDIGMASRSLKDSELAELTEIPIALDGIAVIVNNRNTLTGLNTEQVRGIFTGELTKWSDVQ